MLEPIIPICCVKETHFKYNDIDRLKVKGEKNFYIPLYSSYVINVDTKAKKINTDKGSDLIIWK